MPTVFAAALLAAAPLLQGDQLVLVNGRVMKDLRVVGETYKEVTYRTSTGQEGRKPAEEVLEVIHDVGPAVLEDYATALDLMAEGDFAGAIGLLDDVARDERVTKRYDWAIQHVHWRLANCYYSLADSPGVVRSVDALLEKDKDTFFYSQALMLKARALASFGNDPAGARAVYEKLAGDVVSLGLPGRAAAEAELGLVLLDTSGTPEDRQKRLLAIVEKHRQKYPTVANRASVEIGNLMVARQDWSGAEQFFRRIVDGGQSDSFTEAAAWSGLGDVYFHQAQGTDDTKKAAALYQQAALAHLRVVLVHKEVIELAPRSMYHSAVSLGRVKDELSLRQAYALAALMDRRYPRSDWTEKLFKEMQIPRQKRSTASAQPASGR